METTREEGGEEIELGVEGLEVERRVEEDEEK